MGAILSIPIAKTLIFIPIPVFEPWMHQMGIIAVLTMVIIMVLSNVQNKGADDSKAIEITKDLFKTSPLFNIGSFIVCIILAVLYAMFC